MKKLLILALLLAAAPAMAQHVTEAGLENRDYKGRIRVVASDPDGGACTLTSPPTIQYYDNSTVSEFFCCTSSTWSQCDPAGGGDVTGPASSVDNEIVRFDSTTGKLVQAYTSNGPVVTDVGVLQTTTSTETTQAQPGIYLYESDTTDENLRLSVNGGNVRFDRINDVGTQKSLIWLINGDAGDAGATFTYNSTGDIVLGAGQDVTIGGSSVVLPGSAVTWTAAHIFSSTVDLTRQSDSVVFQIEISGNGDLVLVEQ